MKTEAELIIIRDKLKTLLEDDILYFNNMLNFRQRENIRQRIGMINYVLNTQEFEE